MTLTAAHEGLHMVGVEEPMTPQTVTPPKERLDRGSGSESAIPGTSSS